MGSQPVKPEKNPTGHRVQTEVEKSPAEMVKRAQSGLGVRTGVLSYV
jgi:hypothetical protein